MEVWGTIKTRIIGSQPVKNSVMEAPEIVHPCGIQSIVPTRLTCASKELHDSRLIYSPTMGQSRAQAREKVDIRASFQLKINCICIIIFS